MSAGASAVAACTAAERLASIENRQSPSENPMALQLNQAQLESIRGHAARDYPRECCGILLGKAEGGAKRVAEVVPLANLRHDPARAQALWPLDDPGRETERNRFLIDPLGQLRVEKHARRRGLDVLGYYHSHSDCPAQPSAYDRDHAWPRYSYVIVAVERGDPRELTSWVLAADRSAFAAEPLVMGD
jgi:proteasome lid subunit RPN8/RPN11